MKKLKQILRLNKIRYKLLEGIIARKFKIRYKLKITEPSYDTFMFEIKNKNKRIKILEFLKKKGIGTKNVPDAIKWHFASFWKHALKKKEINSIKKSREKILNYLAIPILIKKPLKTYRDIANFIYNL